MRLRIKAGFAFNDRRELEFEVEQIEDGAVVRTITCVVTHGRLERILSEAVLLATAERNRPDLELEAVQKISRAARKSGDGDPPDRIVLE